MLSPNPVRILHFCDAKESEQYVKAVDKYMQDHKMERRMMILSQAQQEETDLGESID